MLKSRINKEEHEALDDTTKGYYTLVNGMYVLQTDDAAELREAARLAREERDTLKTRLDAIQTDIDAAKAAEEAAREDAARKAKDLPAIEASWQAKLDNVKAETNSEVERLKQMLQTLLVENRAQEIANAISTSPKLILPHIRARLAAEIDGNDGITRVLDADGKPSAMSIAELKQEMIANKDYASIIKASDASGGGATGGGTGGGAAGKSFKDLNETERTTLYRTNPTEFQRLASEAGVAIVR